MSVHGYMECSITVLDAAYDEAVGTWSRERGNPVRHTDGRMETWFNDDCAGYLESALRSIWDELSSIPAPPEAWKAEAHYECFDYPNEDGCITEFDVERGKAVRWRESRVVMAECEPYMEFEPIGGVE